MKRTKFKKQDYIDAGERERDRLISLLINRGLDHDDIKVIFNYISFIVENALRARGANESK